MHHCIYPNRPACKFFSMRNLFQPMKIHEIWVFSFISELFLTKLRLGPQCMISLLTWKNPCKLWDWKLTFSMFSIWMLPYCFIKPTTISKHVLNKSKKSPPPHAHTCIYFLKRCLRIKTYHACIHWYDLTKATPMITTDKISFGAKINP